MNEGVKIPTFVIKVLRKYSTKSVALQTVSVFVVLSSIFEDDTVGYYYYYIEFINVAKITETLTHSPRVRGRKDTNYYTNTS